MARVLDSVNGGPIIKSAYATDRQEALLDLTYGGQFGYAPELSEWVSSQAYVRHNVFAYLLEAPRFFQFMPQPQKWVSALKALVELHPQSIDGLNSKLDVEFSQHAIGGAGEQMDEPVNVKRAQSNLTFSYGCDKYGMPITTFFYNWITYGIMDPETKYALAGTLDPATFGTGVEEATDWLADYYTMTCIFIEPDPQHKRVIKAWLVTNMMPKGTPDINGKRDLTGSMEMPDVSIEFTGITQYSLGVNVLAQGILDSINLKQANPYLRAAFIEEQKARMFTGITDTSKFAQYDPALTTESALSKDADNYATVAAQSTAVEGKRIGTGFTDNISTLRDSAETTKQKQRTF